MISQIIILIVLILFSLPCIVRSYFSYKHSGYFEKEFSDYLFYNIFDIIGSVIGLIAIALHTINNLI